MVIAFIGKKRSGKSTACEYLAGNSAVASVRINFKDKLLSEVQEKFLEHIDAIVVAMNELDKEAIKRGETAPWTVQRLIDEKPPLFRTLLQNYGTDVVRAIDPDYFVKEWERAVESHASFQILTDDIRFRNEYNAVKRQGGVIILIEREGLVSTDTHSSEMEMETLVPDYTITAGTVEELHARLNDVMKNIRA